MPRLWAESRVMSAPSSWIVPSPGSISPATIRSVVVLPQPEGPSSATDSPAATPSVTSRTATVWP
jgi:hypothetical protein